MKLFRNVSFALYDRILSVALASVLSATMLSSVHAGAQPSQLTAQYAGMCASQGTGIPAPLGEADLKGNPKLKEYCECFGAKLAKRALAQGSGTSPSLDEMAKEEQVMRNGCRKQLDLPLLNF